MNILDHIKLAGYIGLIVGILFGFIDIIAKIIALNFEWFEFYLSLLTSSVIFIIAFVIISLFIELFSKITNIYFNKNKLIVFYIVSTISLILLLCGEGFIYSYLPRATSSFLWFHAQINPILSFGYALIIVIIYFLLLIKTRKFILKTITFAKTKKIDKLIKHCIFFVLIFIIFSFFIDVYTLNKDYDFVSKEELKDYPNILLITAESIRPDHLSLYNYHLNTTPNIDKFAKDAIVFENAISASSWSLSAQSSIFTGKYPFNHNAIRIHQKLDKEEVTLAEILTEKGYNTIGFTGGPICKAKFGIGQGFLDYKDRLDFFERFLSFDRFSIKNVFFMILPKVHDFIFNSDGERTSEEINKDVFKWLDKNKNKQPFFIFIKYFEVHGPYTLGGEFKEQFVNKSLNKDISNLIAGYDTEIFYLDYNLNKLFNKFKELNLFENTLIIITSDTGEEFNDHGSFEHGTTLYEEIIHIPLIIYYPKQFEPQRIKERVGNINTFSTILDLLNIKIDHEVNSKSLLPLIRGGVYEEYVFSERWDTSKVDSPKQEAISYKNWKLIVNIPYHKTNMSFELYNLEEDPKEQNNLYGKYEDIENKLKFKRK